MDYSVNIKFLRKKHRLTQDALAEKLGVKRHTICDWESGRTEPNIDYIISLAKVFNVSVDYILGVKKTSNNTEYSFSKKYFANSTNTYNLMSRIKNMSPKQQEIFLGLINNISKYKEED